MIEVHYWACNNPDQQDENDVWIHNRDGIVSIKLADYMLGVRDREVKVEKIDAKHNGVLFSIKADASVWEHYAETLGEYWSVDEDEYEDEDEDEDEDDDPETRRYWKDRNEKVIRIW